MPTIFLKNADGTDKQLYINPFYQRVNKFVINELDARAKLYGLRVRGSSVGDSRPVGVEWSYQKTAWATAKSISHPDIILGTPGSNLMSDTKGNLTLYNVDRNVPNKPLLTKVEITNEGQLGSFLKGTLSFTVFPKFTQKGFDFGKMEDAFFVPGREIELKWGWTVGATASKRANSGAFTGIVYNFSWQFNTDLSVSATVSIISPSGLAVGISGDLSSTGDETTFVEDPSGKVLAGANLASVIDSDMASLAKSVVYIDKDRTKTVTNPIPFALPEGQTWYVDINGPYNLNQKLDYRAITIPIEQTPPDEQARGERITKMTWYVSLGAVTQFINELLAEFNDPIKEIFVVQCRGNETQYNANIVSAYPFDVYFPDRYMGMYGTFIPFNGDTNPLTEFDDKRDGVINIGEILLSTDFVKNTYTRFVKEYSGNSNITYKNITVFFEELLKRINQASGDMYQLTAVLFEPKLNNIEGQDVKSILSIEDANLATKIEVEPYPFDATVFKPLIRNVNISSEPPPAVATAAFVAARGNTRPEQTNAQVSRASDRDLDFYNREYESARFFASQLLFQASTYGFSDNWSEQLRGFLVKMKRSATSADSHWLFKAIYPVDFSVTVDGINGFKFGDTLRTNMIPALYNNDYKMVFTVTKISHIIENKDWQTTLTTKARLTGFGEDAPKSAGSIHTPSNEFTKNPAVAGSGTQTAEP